MLSCTSSVVSAHGVYTCKCVHCCNHNNWKHTYTCGSKELLFSADCIALATFRAICQDLCDIIAIWRASRHIIHMFKVWIVQILMNTCLHIAVHLSIWDSIIMHNPSYLHPFRWKLHLTSVTLCLLNCLIVDLKYLLSTHIRKEIISLNTQKGMY